MRTRQRVRLRDDAGAVDLCSTPSGSGDEPITRVETPGSELREHLARELHDGVAGELQAMLVEMELLSRRQGVPSELGEFRVAIRGALIELRQLLRELRDLPADPSPVQAAIDKKIASTLDRKELAPSLGGGAGCGRR